MMTADDDISVSTANNLEQFNPKEKTAAPKVAKQAQQKQLAQTETRLVLCSKSLVVLVLIASAAVLGYLTYQIMNAEEIEDFHAQFSYDAKEIIDTANVHSISLVSAVQSFAAQYTSSSGSSQPAAVWPNFTLPDFEVFASNARKLSRVQLLGFSPLVTYENRPGWEAYSEENSAAWLQESYAVSGIDAPSSLAIVPFIYMGNADAGFIPQDGTGPYSPLWQLSPPPLDPIGVINYNLFAQSDFVQLAEVAQRSLAAAISGIYDTNENSATAAATTALPPYMPTMNEPWSMLLQPVYDTWNKTTLVGNVLAIVPWSTFFQDALQSSERGIYVILRESSTQNAYTYRVDGPNVKYIGPGDHWHDVKYNDLRQSSSLFCTSDESNDDDDSNTVPTTPNATEGCLHTMEVYPSDETQTEYSSNRPIMFTVFVIVIFFFASFVFFLYDRLVQWRQKKVHDTAIRANAIVFSLFPAKVAEQLQRDAVEEEKLNAGREAAANGRGLRGRRGRMMADRMMQDDTQDGDDDDTEVLLDSKPIADLFPSATVLFADIAGFTAWSSIREPSQVFLLLENIYRAFDKIAVHRGIFKVETIGDCYVAVCGLPEPNEEHAVAMARFARDCKVKFGDLTHKLEAKLGPDTGDLSMRFGLHSGPVTAGVLRGDRARFQLFGDTVNTAARMESTGQRGKIHISQETADLLVVSGKSHWVVSRDDKVVAKGKGELTTYWLVPKDETAQSALGGSDTVEGDQYERLAPGMGEQLAQTLPNSAKNQKIQRMIDWNCDILMQLLRLVVAKREALGEESMRVVGDSNLDNLESDMGAIGGAVTEIHEMIELPGYDSAAYQIDPESVIINDDVAAQLHSYVTVIASMYRDNPFHNFEHASHVSMSTVKLMSRIVAPGQKLKMDDGDYASEELHDHTYGITSDPLTQFSVVLSALIHDVDHRGVPNFVLAQEDSRLATVYQNKSVAEQNSIDVAWEVLMDEEFRELRRTIYTSCDELKRFRQLVVNSVMATDIFDKELSALRKARWERAFGMDESFSPAGTNRKATIVIEHLIQASDVAHTMQHWHVYTKWNERLFREMYSAYTAGRTNTDPTNGWYDGELRFFDGYVIPLAKKLKECGVFGVSSDEYLNYAEKNRAEWLARGQDVVQSFSNKVARKNSMNNQENTTTTNKSSSSESKECNSQTSENNDNLHEQSSNNNKQQISDINVTDIRVSDVKVSDMQAKLLTVENQQQQQSKFTESKLGETDLLDLVKNKKKKKKKQATGSTAGESSSDTSRSTSSSSQDNKSSSSPMKSSPTPTKKFDKKKQTRTLTSLSLTTPLEGSEMNFL